MSKIFINGTGINDIIVVFVNFNQISDALTHVLKIAVLKYLGKFLEKHLRWNAF